MVEIIFPITKKEGAILSSVSLDPQGARRNEEYIGVKFEEGEKGQLVLQLIEKGYLALNDQKLSLTETGKNLAAKFDIAILKED